ncbi:MULTISPECIES: flagellar biosynthetic protein FliO [unclassified Mesorhizobium]|uniref:flagellar biosynthetic protein FliO n=1 Tax=unclassified Mesorhizobium TaxID=325217 RepID=UPI0015E48EA7|nr:MULTISPECIES: flagellar biosynthetic protein FliO [unclassified Mesorhizobium]MBZ9897237.1 flagellar biosynthetic protein FliO [Mesorhizobium sp. BR1-1-6]MBZ9960998.1 flagellar biosynthetic protein FliO [Mesorhizobium sp. BR1-1-14]MBZ9981120.1 flagellar biosynthetic protein FliO [Mesorhizobium sp. BR-1-1-8]
MLQWLDSVAGPGYVAALLWTFAALVLLVIVLIIVKLVRNLTFGTFVAGGRNRKTRLAVMDATAVDSHRRLVLVRRDDIEHLLLIGGPTDVVVERDIRLSAPRRPALTGDGGSQQPVAVAKPRAPQPTPAPARQAPAPQPVSAAPPARQRAPEPVPKPAAQGYQPTNVTPLPSYGSANVNAVRHAPPPASPPPGQESIDETLMKELEVSLDQPRSSSPATKPVAKTPPSLDDEMTRLLGELSSQKR